MFCSSGMEHSLQFERTQRSASTLQFKASDADELLIKRATRAHTTTWRVGDVPLIETHIHMIFGECGIVPGYAMKTVELYSNVVKNHYEVRSGKSGRLKQCQLHSDTKLAHQKSCMQKSGMHSSLHNASTRKREHSRSPIHACHAMIHHPCRRQETTITHCDCDSQSICNALIPPGGAR